MLLHKTAYATTYAISDYIHPYEYLYVLCGIISDNGLNKVEFAYRLTHDRTYHIYIRIISE